MLKADIAESTAPLGVLHPGWQAGWQASERGAAMVRVRSTLCSCLCRRWRGIILSYIPPLEAHFTVHST